MSTPAERRLHADLEAHDFQAGVAAGMWKLVAVEWPTATFAVSTGKGAQLGMQLNVDDYPVQAPAGQPWDLVGKGPLPVGKWPTGGTAVLTFRPDWSPGNGNAPYLAADRVGLATHPDWSTQHPERAWNPTRTISFYLAEIHRDLRAAELPE